MHTENESPQPYEMNVGYEGGLHHFRTEIPNIVFEMKLDIYELSTYCHLKKTAGDKRGCWKSSKTLCEEIGISLPKLIEVKRSLMNRGLIRIEKRKAENGGNLTDVVTIIDVWALNMKVMLDKYPKRGESPNDQGGGKQDLGGGVNAVKGGTKCHLPKEEQKEEDINRRTATAPAAASSKSLEKEKPQIYPCLQQVDIPPQDRFEITQKYSLEQVTYAIKWALHPQTKINKSLAAAIKWACVVKPDMPTKAEDRTEENKALAMKYNGARAGNCKVEALSKSVEVDTGCPYTFVSLAYDAKGFVEQFISALRKNNFKIIGST